MTGTHPESEDFPWMIAVVDHPDRRDSPAYRHSRALMQELVQTTPDWMLAGEDYQDHHGGSIWVQDDTGWICLQLPLGIEWSAQFCADPAKVDRLRQYAARIVAQFPDTLPGYEALGYTDARTVLGTPITNAANIAAWTDSIFNAGLPLPAATHTGVLPKAAGFSMTTKVHYGCKFAPPGTPLSWTACRCSLRDLDRLVSWRRSHCTRVTMRIQRVQPYGSMRQRDTFSAVRCRVGASDGRRPCL